MSIKVMPAITADFSVNVEHDPSTLMSDGAKSDIDPTSQHFQAELSDNMGYQGMTVNLDAVGAPPEKDSGGSGGDDNTGMIAGAAVGAIALVGVGVFAGFKMSQNKADAFDQSQMMMTAPKSDNSQANPMMMQPGQNPLRA